jgi:cytoskeletal protein CcmA (bactofilin family)
MFKKIDPESSAGEARTAIRTSSPASIIRNRGATPIGPAIQFSGQIRSNADLIVHGHIEGSIHLDEGLLTVTKGGQVDADVSARAIHVEGRIEGDLRATQTIVVRRTGRVRGSITAPRVVLDVGCTCSCAIDMNVAEESAPATRGAKVAEFKSAISSTRARPAKSATGKASPR